MVARRLDSLPAAHRDLWLATAAAGWIALLLVTDQWSDPAGQQLWGAATWAVLWWLLRAEAPVVAVQVAVVVVFATAVEYTFSALLGVYLYRLGGVPAFVPPGHGLVYLASLALGRWPPLLAHRRPLSALTLAVGLTYAVWGLVGGDRVDALGAFWFGCLVLFLALGRSGLLYVGAFVIVTGMELLGTWLHVWQWQRLDPTGLIGIGNPPSGVAGGYAWFDLLAVLLAPAILRRVGEAGRLLRRAATGQGGRPASRR